MRQRALIAMSVACRPEILVADEPTSALDAIVQAGILDLLRGLREERGVSILLASPRHPYTLGLLRSLPPPLGSSGPVRLQPIAGSAPPPWERPVGCRFRNRCPRAQDDCA